ncbi:MAG: stage II sporulation protein M, partial [Armatimonadetes bacterium]|nr:stage II sporulation protein M [Armatimonadota bacterium]
LAALVTAGAAGLKLGHALLAGGRVTRLTALRQAGAEALPLLLGCLPWFVAAALIEGFLTPLAVPAAAKLLFGLLSGGLLAYYLAASAREPADVDAVPADLPGPGAGQPA